MSNALPTELKLFKWGFWLHVYVHVTSCRPLALLPRLHLESYWKFWNFSPVQGPGKIWKSM